jgi:hypothetical protein
MLCGLTLSLALQVQVQALICAGACEEKARKVYTVVASRHGETSRLGSRDPVATHDQMWAAWWQEEQDEVVYGSFVEPQSQDQAEIIMAAKS